MTHLLPKRPFTTSIACLFLLLVACGDTAGTEPDPDTGSISGRATADGVGVAGATITLQGGGSRTTSGAGEYSFTNVAPGSRTLSLAPPEGFDLAAGESASKSVTVVANQTATADWALAATTNGTGGDVVEIRLTTGNRFSPESVTISAGTTVRWINDANIHHTVTPNDPNQAGVWNDVTTSSAGVVLEHTFRVDGETYDYFCQPHQAEGMVGEIIVQ